MHDGELVMLDAANPNSLSWLRRNPKTPPVLVTCNFTPRPQTASFDLSGQGVSGNRLVTLARTPGTADAASLKSVELPPFGVYIAEVR
jgi:hypothetical protein